MTPICDLSLRRDTELSITKPIYMNGSRHESIKLNRNENRKTKDYKFRNNGRVEMQRERERT